ncbi:MAG: hypothetical protein H6Q10_921 [Acidobacteria bacterium]|nr:hypothetical protein [Acidobacteriota bacterium]
MPSPYVVRSPMSFALRAKALTGGFVSCAPARKPLQARYLPPFPAMAAAARGIIASTPRNASSEYLAL